MEEKIKSKNSKTVVITGASSGVGRATAHAYAKMGCRLALLARNEKALQETLNEVIDLGGSGQFFPVDVSHSQRLETVASQIEASLGPIDIWVNNAMVSMMAPFDQMQPEEFERITQVTYLGTVYGTLAALKRMKKQNHGVIVQVGSALAHRSIPLQSAYCGAKHAIQGFTESLRCELLHEKSPVQITMVQLPGLNTPQFNWVRNRMPKKSKPVGAIFQPEVAAKAIVFASAHPRKEFFVGFPTFESVVGNKFIPSLLDRYLAKKVYQDHFTGTAENPDRPDNLFSPVPTDYGTRGPYSQLSKDRSLEFTISKNRKWIFLLTAFGAWFYFRNRAHPQGAPL